jgi:hypothetical protein
MSKFIEALGGKSTLFVFIICATIISSVIYLLEGVFG